MHALAQSIIDAQLRGISLQRMLRAMDRAEIVAQDVVKSMGIDIHCASQYGKLDDDIRSLASHNAWRALACMLQLNHPSPWNDVGCDNNDSALHLDAVMAAALEAFSILHHKCRHQHIRDKQLHIFVIPGVQSGSSFSVVSGLLLPITCSNTLWGLRRALEGQRRSEVESNMMALVQVDLEDAEDALTSCTALGVSIVVTSGQVSSQVQDALSSHGIIVFAAQADAFEALSELSGAMITDTFANVTQRTLSRCAMNVCIMEAHRPSTILQNKGNIPSAFVHVFPSNESASSRDRDQIDAHTTVLIRCTSSMSVGDVETSLRECFSRLCIAVRDEVVVPSVGSIACAWQAALQIQHVEDHEQREALALLGEGIGRLGEWIMSQSSDTIWGPLASKQRVDHLTALFAEEMRTVGLKQMLSTCPFFTKSYALVPGAPPRAMCYAPTRDAVAMAFSCLRVLMQLG